MIMKHFNLRNKKITNKLQITNYKKLVLEEHSVPGLCTHLTVFRSHENVRAQLDISCRMYLQKKRKVVDENMKKQNN